MKKFFSLFAAVALLASGSCSKSIIPHPQNTGYVEVVVNATSAQTKTEFSSDGVYSWKAGDEISIFTTSGVQCPSSFVAQTSGVSTEFVGSKEQQSDVLAYAVYPYDGDAACSVGGVVSTTIPSEQDGTIANALSVAVASSQDDFPFVNASSIVKMTFNASDEINFASITFADNVTGSIKVDCSTGEIADATSNTVSVSSSSAFDGAVFFAIAPVSKGPVTLEFRNLSGEVATKTANVSKDFSAGTIKNLGTVSGLTFSEILTVSLENDLVAEYLDLLETSPYTIEQYKVTYIEDYYERAKDVRKDIPAPVTVAWDSPAGASSQTLVVSENADFSNPERTVSLAASASSYDIYNLIPNRRYYCRVTASDEVVKNFVINTTGRRRMLSIDGVGNVRDLGGIRTTDGTHRIKYGRIYRGCRMNSVTSETPGITISQAGIDEMKRVGIGADMELRDEKSSNYTTSSPLGTDIDFQRFPDAIKSYFAHVCEDDSNIEEMQWLIDELKAGKNVYFHCKTGADRTGTLAYLIEGLLGCCESDVSADLELTSFFWDFGDGGKNSLRKRYGNSSSMYDYHGMYKKIRDNYKKSPDIPLQQKFYNYFNQGIGTFGSAKISSADLDWFISEMLEEE